MTNEALTKYTFKEHLEELRSRIIKCLSVFLTSSAFGYFHRLEIFAFILEPLTLISVEPHISHHQQSHVLIYTKLTEAFVSYINVALFTGLAVSLPFFLYQLYRFISPGLYKKEKLVLRVAFFLSIMLFYLGILFVKYTVMPQAWRFFLSFESPGNLVFQGKVSEYLSLSVQFMFAFGLAFQLPIALILLKLFNIVSTKSLREKRRLAIVINFIVAGVLAPPDMFSHFLLAIPMLLLYEIAIIMSRITET